MWSSNSYFPLKHVFKEKACIDKVTHQAMKRTHVRLLHKHVCYSLSCLLIINVIYLFSRFL